MLRVAQICKKGFDHFKLHRYTKLLFLTLLLALPAIAKAQFDFDFTTNNGTITITRYTGPGGAVTIPDSINEMPVTEIASRAFAINFAITSVEIGANVININAEAFFFCNVTSITIPSSATNIGIPLIYLCSGLENITVDAANPFYSSLDGVFFNKSQTTLLHYPITRIGSYVIPESVTNIVKQAFQGCNGVNNITIPSGVSSIGTATFDGCYNMTNIVIPDNVSSIGTAAFNGCSGLTSFKIPSGLTNIAVSTFQQCSGLTQITIPNTIITISDGAFLYTSLYNVTIPSSVTSIGFRAFAFTSLMNVTIAGSVTNLDSYAFECPHLTNVYFKGNPPAIGNGVFETGNSATTIYYMPRATGWGSTFDGHPTAPWNPQVRPNDKSFGVRTNQFGFTITGSSNLVIVVEASTNLATPIWSSLSTNTLNIFTGTNGTSYFSDPDWMNYPGRFYRFRSP